MALRRFRRVLLNTHLIVGAAAAPFLLLVGATGAALVFEPAIADAVNAPVTHVTPAGAPLSLAALDARVAAARPGAHIRGVTFPERPDRAYQVSLSPPNAPARDGVVVDPYTGRVLAPLSALRTPLRGVHQFHTQLRLGEGGSSVVGWSAVALLFLCASGIVLWWPLKIFRVRRDGTRYRVVFDLHAALGIYSWVFLLLFAVTGVVVHWEEGSQAWIARVTGPASVPPPPRRVAGCDAAHMLSADTLLAAARAAVPGAGPVAIQLAAESPTTVRLRYPEDRTPAGRTSVFVDGCTARVLGTVSSRTVPAAYKYTRVWNRSLHTGDVFGWPTRVLAALASLSLPLSAITGPLLWLMKRRRQARSRTAA